MNFWKELLKKNWAPYTIATCSAVLLFWGLSHISNVLDGISVVYHFVLPVVMGMIIAYVLNPLVEFIERKLFHKMTRKKVLRRNLSVATAIVIVLALFVLLMVALIPQIVSSVLTFSDNFEGYVRSFRAWFTRELEKPNGIGSYLASIDFSWEEALDRITEILSNYFGDSENISNIVGTSYNVGKGFANLLIACILAIYFLIDMPRIIEAGKRVLRVMTTAKKYNNAKDFMGRCNHILLRFIVCDVIEGIIVGVINAIFMAILGMDYVVLISVVVGVTNLAPTFGPIVGCLIGCFILLLVHPWWALWFLIFTIGLQTVDGYIIKPKLYGDTLGISPLLILIAIVVGGRIFGVAGILLAIPFAAICDYVICDLWWDKVERNKRANDMEYNAERMQEEQIEAEEE